MSRPTSRPRPRRVRPEPDVPGLLAREGAASLLAEVLDRGRMLDEAGLAGGPAERAEAHGLADLVLRRLGQIDAVLSDRVPRKPPAPAVHVLRVMAAELLFAERAAHAAVDLAVRATRRAGQAKLSGLVNAVGRRLAAEGSEAVAGQDAPRLAPPEALSRRLEADWGRRRARAIAAAHLVPAPMDLTPRDPAEAAALAEALGAHRLPTGTLRLPKRAQISALPGYSNGAFWAQDAAAALPVRMLGDVAGRRVLDLCAAPGGKTLQLAALGAEVTALDLSEARLARLGENLARTGLAAETVVADAREWAPPAPFDAILLDAPCSASGTLRRHPDLAHRLDPDGLGPLLALQATLIDRAAEWLRPGGRLVFATCSLFRAEGEAQAEAARARLPALRPARPEDPALAPFLDARGQLRTRPDMMAAERGMDGFFAAAFDRVSG